MQLLSNAMYSTESSCIILVIFVYILFVLCVGERDTSLKKTSSGLYIVAHEQHEALMTVCYIIH